MGGGVSTAVKQTVEENNTTNLVLNNNNTDISNSINNEAFTLIQLIRDEAHRFAILNQRKRHNKLMFNSKLDGIPGIGDERKKTIINQKQK